MMVPTCSLVFLVWISFVLGAPTFESPSAVCSDVLDRKEWRELTRDEKEQFYNGIGLMKAKPSLLGGANRFEVSQHPC